MLNNFLLFLAGVLALALAALFAVPMAIDWNQYRSVFEQQATRLLGRDVRVGEGVNLRLLPSPYVRFENVRIADSTGRFDRPLARIEAFTLWLSVAPLLRGEIEAKEVELTAPELRLAMDQNGQGNWFGLGSSGGDLAFVPRDVALKSVRISDGRLRFVASSGEQLAAFDQINGDLSSPTINGPYRFQGTLEQAGVLSEVRFSTSRIADVAALPFKAAMRLPAKGHNYEFDGQLLDLMSKPTIEGALSGRIELASDNGPGPEHAAAANGSREPAPPARVVDLRARVEADPMQLRLTDLALTFDSIGQPQALNGEMLVGWQRGTVLAAELKARWLDLDTILGVERSVKLQPWRAAAGLVRDVGLMIPPMTKARLSFIVDQATLGGDAVGPLRLEMAREDGRTKIEAFEAAVPGGGHVLVAGHLIENAGLPGFAGPLRARGTSLSRFLSWLEPELVDIGAGDGAFLLSANLEADDRRIAFTRAFGEIAGSGFKGNMEYRARARDGSGRTGLVLDLDSDNLDISTLARLEHVVAPIGALLEISSDRATEPTAGQGQSQTSDQAGSQAGSQAAGTAFARNFLDMDSQIDLRLGRLVLADGQLRDVSVAMRLADGVLVVPQIRLESDDGMSLEISGKATGVGTAARGKLQFAMAAVDGVAVRKLAHAIGGADQLPADVERIADFAPLRLAGTVELGAREGSAMQISLDGIAGASRAVVMARIDGAGALIDRDVDLRATLSATDGRQLLMQVAPHLRRMLAADEAGQGADRGGLAGGNLSVRAVGTPSGGMSSALTFQAAEIAASFAGETRFIDGVPTISGEAQLRSPHGQLALALGGLDRFFDSHGDELAFVGRIDRRAGGYDLRDARLTIGEREMLGGGRLELARNQTRFDLSLNSTQLRLGELLAFSVRPPAKTAAVAAAASPDALSEQFEIWSKHAFDFSPLDGLEGKVALDVDTLEIADGLALGDVKLVAALAPAGLQVELTGAQVLKGQLVAKAALQRRSAGARLEASFDLMDLDLGGIVDDAGDAGRLRGKANAHVELTGQGLSPRGLAAVLKGQGQLAVRGMGIRDLDPALLDKIADALVNGAEDFDAAAVREQLLVDIAGADYDIGDQALAITIADGAMKLSALEAAAATSRLRITTQLDLADLALQSEWQLVEVPQAGAANADVTPTGVGLLYSGALADVTRLEAILDLDTLERELAFRRIVRERIDRPALPLDSGSLSDQWQQDTVPNPALASEGLLLPPSEVGGSGAGLGGGAVVPLPAIAPASGSNAAATATQPRQSGQARQGDTQTGTPTNIASPKPKSTRDDDIWRSTLFPR